MKAYTLQHNNQLSDTTFYKTRKLAQKALKIKRDEIVNRFVSTIHDKPDEFTFLFGWEEHRVSWRVNEIIVLDEE